MTNLNAPAGLKACDANGSAYNIPLRRVYFAAGDSTACFNGSIVKFTGATAPDGYTPVVTLAAPGDTKLAGAIQGFAAQMAGNWTTYYRAASTAMYAMIPRNPNQIYMAQEDSVGGNMALTTSIGKNVEFTAESGNTTTGQSTIQLDSSTVADTNSLTLRIVGPVARADNDTASTNSYAAWLVTINLSDFATTTGT